MRSLSRAFTPVYFAGKREIGESSTGVLVVIERGTAETRCFREPDVSRYYGPVNAIAEVFLELRRHFVGEIISRVEHRPENAVN